ncbi:GNAT family N-acetyltransferase [Alicyclobacillus cycloheptanicus]|uniref:Ribosomal-protein-serine acetyltransferase n=1 Tax=Alicyclobacillus cycloheptanicus TaxID=1457 RepID=A0ABT9XDZ1_9BACL|nr:GNAT family protein [Alicyclobacillus cycloheptanicus]MDQ0188513.1 ribosomal-protein-serine acetyltransferase [Alicyclobacillus cycloheptanicus]WDM01200.1 GNAT family N-acetyltransferase [Alicyclobacillus cycloheptanicus]
MFFHPVNTHIQLKLLDVQDADELFQLTDTSRHSLREWLPWVDVTQTAEDSKRFIQSALQQFANHQGFQAGILYDGALAGTIGFHAISWANRSTSIGYWLGEGFRGKGIMTTACKAMVDIAFRGYGLHRVEIRAAVENHKSRAIPERLGFCQEGVCRQAEWIRDHFVDHVVYSMLADDWTEGE